MKRIEKGRQKKKASKKRRHGSLLERGKERERGEAVESEGDKERYRKRGREAEHVRWRHTLDALSIGQL